MLKMVGVIYEEDDDCVLSAEVAVKAKVAMDSGACGNAINPGDLPAGVVPSGNPTGKVFHGAKSSPTRRYGHADVSMAQNEWRTIGSRWRCLRCHEAFGLCANCLWAVRRARRTWRPRQH